MITFRHLCNAQYIRGRYYNSQKEDTVIINYSSFPPLVPVTAAKLLQTIVFLSQNISHVLSLVLVVLNSAFSNLATASLSLYSTPTCLFFYNVGFARKASQVLVFLISNLNCRKLQKISMEASFLSTTATRKREGFEKITVSIFYLFLLLNCFSDNHLRSSAQLLPEEEGT